VNISIKNSLRKYKRKEDRRYSFYAVGAGRDCSKTDKHAVARSH
jgi:hypothetical protein